jgi:hypothetical protein
MKILLGIMATAALATTPTLAVAKGRIKGAVVGAAAGHMVGHGHAVAGAAVGSMVGHHHAKKMARH